MNDVKASFLLFINTISTFFKVSCLFWFFFFFKQKSRDYLAGMAAPKSLHRLRVEVEVSASATSPKTSPSKWQWGRRYRRETIPKSVLLLYLLTYTRDPFLMEWATFFSLYTTFLFLSSSSCIMQFNFVGKLLGPKGNSLKRLQEETLTKMAILGRGSMRDKHKANINIFFLKKRSARIYKF